MLEIQPAAKATITTTPSIALSSTLIVGKTPTRVGFYIWNNSSNSIYVTFGPTSNSSTPTVIIPTFTSYISLGSAVYTGPISGIRNAGSGTVTITELISN